MKNSKLAEKHFSETVTLKNGEGRGLHIEQRKFYADDLAAIAQVHIEAFPSSTWTKLGKRVVENYYLWQLTGNHPLVTAEAVYVDGICTGFLVAGLFRDSTSGFISLNRKLLAGKVLFKPYLLFDQGFRESFYAGCRLLKNYIRRKNKKQTIKETSNDENKSYGILAIAVSPHCQGLGIGKILMRTAENTAVSMGFKKMNLTVNPSNEQAIKFYERLSWERKPANEKWKGLMEKQLL